MIRAIETRYKGYRFRSRLEARWAVFFDALGLDWEYEKEGFDLGDDGRYLPDFWIWNWSTWVEIKSKEPERGYLLKPTAFAATGEPLLLICGNPWPGKYRVDDLRGFDEDNHELNCEFADCRDCDDGVCLCRRDETGYWTIGQHVNCNFERMPVSLEQHAETEREICWTKVGRALKTASSARFEHGETPR